MYKRLFSRKLSSYCKKYCFLSAALFDSRKGLSCTDALLTISHHLQKSIDAGMESNIDQLNFSEAFDRVSHCGLLFKLKSIVVGSSVLSICRVFLNRRQRVVDDGGTNEWSQSFQACHREVCWTLYCSSYIPANCFSWRGTDYMPMQMAPHYCQLFAMPADRPALAAFLDMQGPGDSGVVHSLVHDTES